MLARFPQGRSVGAAGDLRRGDESRVSRCGNDHNVHPHRRRQWPVRRPRLPLSCHRLVIHTLRPSARLPAPRPSGGRASEAGFPAVEGWWPAPSPFEGDHRGREAWRFLPRPGLEVVVTLLVPVAGHGPNEPSGTTGEVSGMCRPPWRRTTTRTSGAVRAVSVPVMRYHPALCGLYRQPQRLRAGPGIQPRTALFRVYAWQNSEHHP